MFCESVGKGDDQSGTYEGVKLDYSTRVYSLGYNSEVFLFILKYYIIVVLTKHVVSLCSSIFLVPLENHGIQ